MYRYNHRGEGGFFSIWRVNECRKDNLSTTSLSTRLGCKLFTPHCPLEEDRRDERNHTLRPLLKLKWYVGLISDAPIAEGGAFFSFWVP